MLLSVSVLTGDFLDLSECYINGDVPYTETG